MRSILEEFFHGNISPEAQCFKSNSRYGDLMRIISRNEDKLLELLNDEEEKEILKKYTDAQMELNQVTAVKSQMYGFKLALLMTAEAFLTSEELIVGSRAWHAGGG